jgi:hypothetical protein
VADPIAGDRPAEATGLDKELHRWTKFDINGNTVYYLPEVGPDTWEYLSTEKNASLFGSALVYGSYTLPLRIFTPFPDMKIRVSGPEYAAAQGDHAYMSFTTDYANILWTRVTGKNTKTGTFDEFKSFLKDMSSGKYQVNGSLLTDTHDEHTRQSYSCDLKNGFTFIITNRKTTSNDRSYYHMFDKWEWKEVVNNNSCISVMGMDDLNALTDNAFVGRVIGIIGELNFNKDLPLNLNVFSLEAQVLASEAGTKLVRPDLQGIQFRSTVPFLSIVK